MPICRHAMKIQAHDTVRLRKMWSGTVQLVMSVIMRGSLGSWNVPIRVADL
jgi:hypothetical protein